ncbi:MAG: Mur ligase family protein [Victivallis sp.]
MGTNHHGEIEPLSCCALPQVALVNSIAPCHLEFLGSLEGIAGEKSRIFSGLPADGTAVIPRSCPAVEVLAEAAAPFRLLRFGEGGGCAVEAHYCGGRLEGSSFELRFADGERFEISWSLTRRHQAVNAAAAAAAALAAGIAPAVIAEGLERTVLPGMRGKLVRSGGVTYLNDAYNANPAACAPHSSIWPSLPTRKLILLLGEMRELGPESEAAHREIYGLAARLFPGARIVTVGDGFRNAGGGEHFASAADARRVTAEAKPVTSFLPRGRAGSASSGVAGRGALNIEVTMEKAENGGRFPAMRPEGRPPLRCEGRYAGDFIF